MYHLLINGQRSGPYSEQDVRDMLFRGTIGPDVNYWRRGMESWESLGSSPVFNVGRPMMSGNPNIMMQPNAQAFGHQATPVFVQPIIVAPAKSRVAYILLGLFLGGLGVHNFYAGYTGRGVAQLLLNLCLFGTIVVPFGIGIWVLIEVIVTDRDPYGIPFG